MREARELPIGSVRERAVAHLKVDPRGVYYNPEVKVSEYFLPASPP
jgi:hypothetical protein